MSRKAGAKMALIGKGRQTPTHGAFTLNNKPIASILAGKPGEEWGQNGFTPCPDCTASPTIVPLSCGIVCKKSGKMLSALTRPNKARFNIWAYTRLSPKTD
jgi:hypothetical protein